LIIGFDTADDAGVYRLRDDLALVQTLDFVTPVVDDHLDYGRIAALNSLNDVWAMGGTLLTALAIVCFPRTGTEWGLLGEIMRGGLEILTRYDVRLLGGHTVACDQIMFGYSITGLIDPTKVASNSGARPGNVLVLTKPIGTGVISSAARNSRGNPEMAAVATQTMLQSGEEGAAAINEFAVIGATDVSGFGLLGHAWEMARASCVTIEVESSKVPLLTGTLELAASGILTAADKTNRDYIGHDIEINDGLNPALCSLLYDPQTSGGLLIAVPQGQITSLLARIRNSYPQAAIIGRVIERGKYSIIAN
jgi:selenide,water dikinase